MSHRSSRSHVSNASASRSRMSRASNASTPHRSSQSHTSIENFRSVLEKELNAMWTAQSEITQREAVTRVVGEFFSRFENRSLSKEEEQKLGIEVWITLSSVVLMESALVVPNKVEQDHEPYLKMLDLVAEFLFELYRSQNKTDLSERCTVMVMRHFAKVLNSGKWEIRYRVLQLGNKFLMRCADAEVLFSSADDDEQRDGDKDNCNWKMQLFLRTYDTNQKVAALAVQAVGHYQYEMGNPTSSKAFLVLQSIMQEHPAAIVRCAAIKAIHLCALSLTLIVRRVMDVNAEVKVTAYDVIRELVSPKILNPQLRSFLCLEGFNHSNLQVRSAAIKCMEDFLAECNSDYGALFGSVGAATYGSISSKKQLTMEIFAMDDNNAENSGDGTVVLEDSASDQT